MQLLVRVARSSLAKKYCQRGKRDISSPRLGAPVHALSTCTHVFCSLNSNKRVLWQRSFLFLVVCRDLLAIIMMAKRLLGLIALATLCITRFLRVFASSSPAALQQDAASSSSSSSSSSAWEDTIPHVDNSAYRALRGSSNIHSEMWDVTMPMIHYRNQNTENDKDEQRDNHNLN